MEPPQNRREFDIVKENSETLKHFRKVILNTAVTAAVAHFFILEVNLLNIALTLASLLAECYIYCFMSHLAHPTYRNGALVDPGIDLNIKGGVADCIGNLITLISGTVLLSFISNYSWFLLILAIVHVGLIVKGIEMEPYM